MNRTGHAWGALCFAPVPLALMADATPLHSILAFLGCLSGSSAPDWLEFDRIPHRTYTHTLSLWLAVTAYGYHLALGDTFVPIEALKATSTILGAILCGFGCGCISHWLGDVLNRQPVPIFTPFDRYCLNLFASGSHQRITCAFIFSVACILAAFLRPLSFRIDLLKMTFLT